MMNNNLPPSYGAIENNVPPPKYEGEGPSNETTIEMPPSRNENQQTQVEDQKPSLNVLIALVVFVICFCFFGWLIFSIPIIFLICFASIYWGLPFCYLLGAYHMQKQSEGL